MHPHNNSYLDTYALNGCSAQFKLIRYVIIECLTVLIEYKYSDKGKWILIIAMIMITTK